MCYLAPIGRIVAAPTESPPMSSFRHDVATRPPQTRGRLLALCLVLLTTWVGGAVGGASAGGSSDYLAWLQELADAIPTSESRWLADASSESAPDTDTPLWAALPAQPSDLEFHGEPEPLAVLRGKAGPSLGFGSHSARGPPTPNRL